MRGIIKEMPAYNYLYLGDTARTPYGTRSKEIVYEFAKQAVSFMFANNCELVILACNTASSDALRKIQHDYLLKHYPDKKVLGVLVPAVEEAVCVTGNKRIGVMATEGTVQSNAFARELVKIDSKVKVFQNSCPLLVPVVEAGEQNSKAANMILKNYIRPLKNKGIDTLILGCTHYGVLERKIRKIVGSGIAVISEAKAVPKKLEEYLENHPEIEQRLGKKNLVKFYTTDLSKRFITLGSKFFGKNIKAQKVHLG